MQKLARKKSNDPIQENLRSHKETWNTATKELISRIIAFKRALNGRGDSHYSLPTSKIHEPFPNEIGSFLNNLSSNFDAVSSEALKIIQEQSDYSKNRKQPAPKTASLISEGSNKLTRMWSYLKSPFLSDENKKIRISLLKMCANMDKSLDDLESVILKSSPESIKEAAILFSNFENNVDRLSKTFYTLMSLESLTKDDPIIQEANLCIEDFKHLSNIKGVDSTIIDKVNQMTDKLESSKDYNKIINQAKIITDFHKNFLAALNKKKSTNSESLLDLSKNEEVKQITANFVSKFVNKTKHNLNPFNESSASRLSIYESIKFLRETFDMLMSELESKIDPEVFKKDLSEINSLVSEIKEKFKPLIFSFKKMKYEKTPDSENLNDKEVSNLERKIKLRKQREYLDALEGK